VRVRPERPARRAVLIVCEGAETEPCYFRALARALGLSSNVSTVEIDIRGDTGYTDPQGLVNIALELEKERARKARASTKLAPFEDVWIVFDVEHPSNGRSRSIRPAVQLALAKRHNPVLSRPSFEVWYLLHDRPNPPGVTCSADCIPYLKKCAGAYAKDKRAAEKITTWALPRTGRALEHGHQQDIFRGPETSPTFHIPSAVGTAVHRLVQSLVDMSSDEAGKQMLGLAPPARAHMAERSPAAAAAARRRRSAPQ